MSQVDRGRKKCLEGKKQKKNISMNKLSKRGDPIKKIHPDNRRPAVL